MSLIRTVKPTTTPVSPKEAIQVFCADDEDAVRFRSLIKRAVEYIETYCNRSLMTQTWVQRFDCFSARYIELHKPPVQSVSSITYYDTDNVQQTLSAALYEVDIYEEPAILRPIPSESWPDTYDRLAAVEITYVTGYASADAVPETLKDIILQLVNHWYEHVGAVTELRLAEDPFRVNDQLFPYKVPF